MKGVHDLGGLEGFGAVEVEPDEPYFHEPWERRAFGIGIATFALAKRAGQFRHAVERMDPVHYLTSSYYEHWLTASATVAVEEGVATAAELEARAPGYPLSQPPTQLQPPGGPSSDTPRFAPGDDVRVRRWPWPGHCRCPGYVQGRRGTIARVDFPFSEQDLEERTGVRRVVPTYSVRFDPAELWGTAPESGAAAIHVDLWETYLEDD